MHCSFFYLFQSAGRLIERASAATGILFFMLLTQVNTQSKRINRVLNFDVILWRNIKKATLVPGADINTGDIKQYANLLLSKES